LEQYCFNFQEVNVVTNRFGRPAWPCRRGAAINVQMETGTQRPEPMPFAIG
jgi:hypothetical protein